MASTTETGHAKNVANFREIITIIKSFGAKYQPISDSIKIENLENMANQAEQVLLKLKEAETLYKQVNAALQGLFKNMNPLVTQIMGLLSSSDAKASSIEEARNIAKLITGANAKKKKTEENSAENTEAKNTRSVSRQSYDSRLDNFEKLVTVLQNISEYKPNEDAFKVSSLQNIVLQMKNAIKENDEKELIKSQWLEKRNQILYTPETGLVDISIKIKEYVKGAFGGTKSKEYKDLTKIRIIGLNR
ncbi:MAG: hypothetical protein OHK0038_17240 [Flammeovirgaceae bacterium]